MKMLFDKKLSKIVNKWKEDQKIESLSFDELLKEVGNQEVFISEKIDGELEGMFFDNKAKFCSKDGRVRWDMPVLNEIESILKKQKINSAIIFGELAKTSSHGKPVHFNETMSAIRKPEIGEEESIDFFPFELYELDDKKVSSDYNNYKDSFNKLLKWFRNSKHVCPVSYKIGKKDDLKSAWDVWVKKEKNEGIVVRTEKGKIYKSKPLFTLDLCVIAVQEGKGKNKGKMGALVLGFYDGLNFYKVVNLGVGFSDIDRGEWWKLAQKNKVNKKEDLIWIDPFKMNKVIETSYERINYRPVDTYKFVKNKWQEDKSKFAATISKPGFIRIRDDKQINKYDLRLSQIPDFEKMKKNFHKNSKLFISYEVLVKSILETLK